MKIPFKYNWRSLLERKSTTILTVLSIAFVVLVFIGVLSLATGLEKAFSASGDPRNVLVLRDGARTETESYTSMENFRTIAAMPQVERGPAGEPLASGELIILQIFPRQDGSESNVVVRGVQPAAKLVRPTFKIKEGRDFEPGKGEVIVGSNIATRFPSLALGQERSIGQVKFRVVGVFEAGGGGSESEVWGALEDIGDSFKRTGFVSSVRVRTSSSQSVQAVIDAVKADQRMRVAAKPETVYYAEQTNENTRMFKVLGTMLAVLMGFGACFAAANTMYAQVARRSREIGTLRAIGFRRRTILIAFMIEAAVLGFLGGVTGALLSLPLNGIDAGTTNFLTFSEMTFQLSTSPGVLLAGVLIAVATGVLGGFPPAISAARQPISSALREA
jgi:putative ABC transport system permease protein